MSSPLILGGDHSIALGSISGVAAVHKDVGVIWIDAHTDFNTEETTPSGNIHGMILAALAGLGNERLTHIDGWSPKVQMGSIVIVGARDIDPGEQALLREHHVHVFTMPDIDRLGMAQVMQQAIARAGQDGHPIHLSLDLDSLDPREAPGGWYACAWRTELPRGAPGDGDGRRFSAACSNGCSRGQLNSRP